MVESAGILVETMRFSRLLALLWAVAMAAFCADKSFVIVLIGPTGSGKTTQAAFLARRYGLPTIAADELIQQNPQALKKYQTPGIDPGEPQASPALNDLIHDRLSRMDAKQGFVLDGYPATKDQADHLESMVKELGLQRPIVILLDVPDKVAQKRDKKRGRADDTPAQIERRLKDYHREMDFVRSYYPEANIHKIDGTRPVAEVSKAIEEVLGKGKGTH
jgi:adenylate kinase